MTPQEKRKHTIIERYGSFKNMLKNRDVRDLILGGYNGGIKRTDKGFSKWEPGELSKYAKKRQRDSQGRFLPEEATESTIHHKDTEDSSDR